MPVVIDKVLLALELYPSPPLSLVVSICKTGEMVWSPDREGITYHCVVMVAILCASELRP